MRSQSNIEAINTKLIAGLQKHYGKKKIVIAGKTWNVVDLVTTFSTENTAIATSATTKEASRQATEEVIAQRTANNPLRAALHQAVLVTFASNAAALNDFGYAVPRKTGRKTGAALVAIAQKAKATREARGTLGSRARKAIHGEPPTSVASAPSMSNGTSNGSGK